ncbi:RING finger domain-containing protein [Cordyceps fumosorosea ARSEF 2679]|uniref:RING finger domain-containing protein n=1 Tax=Cordyceps fumosorosea (strain ARSEF 2679) TaxID=1081104 RepID=A0A167GBY9_CORFA|nr:RING finger domain-containing protein [Cordyceps fumosorosea ARSEF 2679]OAA46426.1 RING finger domain-containing protein [Cordyceps fumosorosea ARSEF 2679]
MGDEVDVLSLKPFRDVVEHANTALENAGDNEVMRKAAKKLLREGEKAVKLIEPQCTKRHTEYGDNFLHALRENEDIKDPRAKLGRLIYGFDEYVEEDEFEADKYTELQGLTRETALKMYEILISMKLEATLLGGNLLYSFLNESSPPSSPIPPPNFRIPPTPTRLSVQSATCAPSSTPAGAPICTFQNVYYANEELKNFRDRQPSSVLAPEDEPVVSPSQRTSPPQQPPPLRPPSANPRNTAVAGSSDEIAVAIGRGRLPCCPLVVPASPQIPPSTSSPVSPGQHRLSPALPRRPIGSSFEAQPGSPDEYPYDEAEWRRLTNQQQYDYQSLSQHSSPLQLNTILKSFPQEGAYNHGTHGYQSVPGTIHTHHGHQVSLESDSVGHKHDPHRDTFGSLPQRGSKPGSLRRPVSENAKRLGTSTRI